MRTNFPYRNSAGARIVSEGSLLLDEDALLVVRGLNPDRVDAELTQRRSDLLEPGRQLRELGILSLEALIEASLAVTTWGC